jgi:hypothetical protein
VGLRRPAGTEVRPLAVLDAAPPLGSRLWLYTNFDCNLACDYCCARSSPRAPARRLPVDVARRACEEFAGLAADGAWWHPVAITEPDMQVASTPLPLITVLAIIRATLNAPGRDRTAALAAFHCT